MTSTLYMEFQSCGLLKALVSILGNLMDSSNRAFIALVTRMRIAWGSSEAAMRSSSGEGRKRGSEGECVRFLASAVETRS